MCKIKLFVLYNGQTLEICPILLNVKHKNEKINKAVHSIRLVALEKYTLIHHPIEIQVVC